MSWWEGVRHRLDRTRRRTAMRLQDRADRARDQRVWPAARRAYALSLKLMPSRPPIWVQYGHALKESGAMAAALRAYGQATVRDPAHADAHFHLGCLLQMLGRFSEAVTAHEKAVLLDPSYVEARRFAAHCRREARPPIPNLPARIRYLNIGTTNVCNASCIHCPTNKDATAHIPRHPMSMALYRKLMHGIYELGLPVHQIGLGLFGDALVDPHVVERARLARSLFPDSELVVNTNGAAFNAKKHGALLDIGALVSLHCESLVPETYDDLMRPLRAARVFPKYVPLLEALQGQVHISIPVTRRNLGELAAMRSWFLERGARTVTFDPLSSRCADDRKVFDSLAIRPGIIACESDVLEDFIVDADGKVLLCCQDFERAEIIGDIGVEEIAESLTNARRLAVKDMLESGRHDCMNTCRKCFADHRDGPDFTRAVPQ